MADDLTHVFRFKPIVAKSIAVAFVDENVVEEGADVCHEGDSFGSE